MNLRDKHILLTGASRGIGATLARHLSVTGARLTLVARPSAALDRIAGELKAHVLPADLGAADFDAAALWARAEAGGGPVHVLINNAGVDLTGDPALTAPGDVAGAYRLNLIAPALLCQQMIRAAERDGGVDRLVVNVSSQSANVGVPGMGWYASTKAGLSHLTRALGSEFGGTRIRFLLVEPGAVPTGMLESVQGYGPTAAAFARFRALGLQRDVPAEELAGAILAGIRDDQTYLCRPRRSGPVAWMTALSHHLCMLALQGVARRSG